MLYGETVAKDDSGAIKTYVWQHGEVTAGLRVVGDRPQLQRQDHRLSDDGGPFGRGGGLLDAKAEQNGVPGRDGRGAERLAAPEVTRRRAARGRAGEDPRAEAGLEALRVAMR